MSDETGRLTTHVLDTAAGRLTGGVRITVSRDGETLSDIGALEPGREADLVALSGPPFHPSTRVLAVMIGGEWVYRAEEAGP